ncbi:RNA polymerase associated protein RapA [hydrothermal vent metagenome]|uniref:RNA polymerase associated protein RapA n=1 Tax=hydrothermal vent metagenome TaxID=652676 RepID=A0A3B0ZV69_9ZZZZ
MKNYAVGQRWISETESDLGLGTIIQVEHRTVTVSFSSCDETRTYALQNAPLARIIFKKNDEIQDLTQRRLTIIELKNTENKYQYYVEDENAVKSWLDETQINHHTKLNNATDRLFSGQIDAEKWFSLRYKTLIFKDTIEQSDTYGLTGARIDLVPHQLYIANEVSNRFSPRVLLADEVGLGKTIEACLILHQQYLTEAVQKILIIVPQALIHQWLVELLRRVNLRFSLLDEERCTAIEENSPEINPFDSEQLVLCSLEQFSENPNRAQQIIKCQWDMLIVDEAHHLYWSEQQPSPEYMLIDVLAKIASSVLLLTATPEQLGQSGHFARLRLLDPIRYHDLASFIKEESSYFKIVEIINKIIDASEITDTDCKNLQRQFFDASLELSLKKYQEYEKTGNLENDFIESLIDKLIDQHGTGRCLFRNSRFGVKGFPNRILNAVALELPNQYKNTHPKLTNNDDIELNILNNQYPEIAYSLIDEFQNTAWWQFDPRIEFLYQTINKLKPKKVLIICAHRDTAEDIKLALKTRYGINIAMFHEDMSIVKRDKSAAFFADPESGSQALVCSEIGSEGRNFQFSHHLILFDLPLIPDLLEQRIGRLDRIGQQHDVQIHALYLKGSAQEYLFRWYHEGLNAFTKTCPAGQNVYNTFYQELAAILSKKTNKPSTFEVLLDKTKSNLQDLNQSLQSGRDRLLELNSHRKHVSTKIIKSIKLNSKSDDLQEYMEHVFGCYGVDFEDHSHNQYIIRPSEHMHTAHFPLLPADGKTITFDRETALKHEDIDFVSWEHPMVTAVIDMISANELGNTAVSLIKHKAIKSGSMLLECLFVLDYSAPKYYQMSQYFSNKTIHIVIDNKAKDISPLFSNQDIYLSHDPVSKAAANQLIISMSKLINMLLEHATNNANTQLTTMINNAHQNINSKMDFEIDRLTTLKKLNPNIREDEIEHLQVTQNNMHEYINNATLRLDATRIIIVE